MMNAQHFACSLTDLRVTRGRCGPLLLHRSGLLPPTSCRCYRRTLKVARPEVLAGAAFAAASWELSNLLRQETRASV
jgi:hypothetical protein